MKRNSALEILIVDDNPADVRLTKEMLRGGGMPNDIHVAKDGVEAMAFVHHEGKFKDAPTPDLILLDLNMPRKDGREVLEEIKSDPELRRIPVVVLTTSAEEKDILKAYDEFVNAYVVKPIHLEQFMKIVKSIDDFWLSVAKLPPKH
jgi:two-component system, chemotaxis family, response regulator Rcp1